MKHLIEDVINSNDITLLQNDINNHEISEIIRSVLEDSTLNCYFDIMKEYIVQKNKLELSAIQIANKCNVPDLTIRRIENLQSIPNIILFLRILNTMDLTLKVVSKNSSLSERD